MKAKTLTIDVVSRHAIIRGGLVRMLAEVPGVANRQELDNVAAVDRQDPPDIVLVDLYDTDKFLLASRILNYVPRSSRVIALYPAHDPQGMVNALRSGVHALVTRTATTADLSAAIESARRCEIYISEELTRNSNSDGSPNATASEYQLTPREIETLRWIALGLTHTQVGRRLGLTESTVSTYVRRIRTKLRASNKADLTRRAIELGYVSATAIAGRRPVVAQPAGPGTVRK